MVYADTEHLHTFGTSLEFSTDNVTYIFVNDLASVDGPDPEMGKSDDTTLQSPNRIKLSTPGWETVGQLKFTCYLNKTQAITLDANFKSRVNYYWRVTLPKLSTESTATTFIARGYMLKASTVNKAEKGNDDKFMCEYEVEMTTHWVIAAGS